MQITIDTNELTKLKADAEVIKLSPEAEQTLARISEIEAQIAEIKDIAKAKLLERAKELNPDFKSWEADNIRVSMRPYGAKYYVIDAELDMAPKDLYRTEADVVTPNEPVDVIVKALSDAGFTVASTKTKGEEKLKISRTVDTKAVDKWVKEHRGMPTGIGIFVDRPVSLTWGAKNNGEEADNE